ncbi:uncharacterized protein LOC116767946 [Danaus plexippus]|uniref:uncharacterized protein LOC116767946 n=1 Tax=Danaus plexippus TaxID=13037 RepID=UPI002AB2BE7C|nr:uncharacterized protein LOC116767946 [Danaus plexippus]
MTSVTIFKRKKNKAEFTAENINNTAPVKNILEEFQDRNAQAYMYYCHNVRQRLTTPKTLQNYHFVVPGYPLNCFDDDWDGALNFDYFEHFSYKSLYPKMITELKNTMKADPLTSFMKTKMSWQRDCRNLKLTAAFTNMNQKYEVLNDEVVQCPKHIVDTAAHIDSDPDPNFDSSYNWYYAGNGNLQLVCIDWIDYLLHSEFSTVYLTQLNRNDLNIKPNIEASFDCGEGKNILETIFSSQNITVLRTKYKIFILSLTTGDEIKFEKIKGIDSEIPFTGISFDAFHKNIIYVTTLDSKLFIVNLDRLKAKIINLVDRPTLIDNWNTVISSERGFYTHVGRQSVTLYDKRSHDTIHIWKNVRNITDEMACNDISVAKHLEGTSSLYFGTDHHLFLMDLRFHQKNAKVVQRWTHGMECVPTYLANCIFESNKDLICLSSQWCEDMCVVPNYSNRNSKDTVNGGVFIPYRPPNILNTLNEARQRRLCYDLYNPIDSRLSSSITGLLVMEQDDRYNILMQNSLGDISCHSLFQEHMETFIEDDSTQCLHDWAAKYKVGGKDFEVSSVPNVANIWNKLKRVPSDYEICENVAVSEFDEKEIAKAFDNEEIDSGLREAWLKTDEELGEQSSLMLNLHFSDDDEE